MIFAKSFLTASLSPLQMSEPMQTSGGSSPAPAPPEPTPKAPPETTPKHDYNRSIDSAQMQSQTRAVLRKLVAIGRDEKTAFRDPLCVAKLIPRTGDAQKN